jgi:glycosyltransferase involved in cell wall biosynthesis
MRTGCSVEVSRDILVSVIVPVYNVESMLRRCVDSILAQTYRNLEIILVDDGSSDRSGEMCDEYAKQDARIRVIHQPNGGLPVARNAGLDVATGAYIAFIDADDRVEPELIEHQVRNALENDAEISICGYLIIDWNGKIQHSDPFRREPRSNNGKVYSGSESVRALLEGCIAFNVWNKLYFAEMLRGLRFDSDQTRVEDAAFNYFAVQRAKRVAILHEYLYVYIRRAGSITTGTVKDEHYIDYRLHLLKTIAVDAKETNAVPDYSVIVMGILFYLRYLYSPYNKEFPQYAKGILSFLWNFYGIRIILPLIALRIKGFIKRHILKRPI